MRPVSRPDRAAAPVAGASELMRSLGLLVDGPVRWATPVPSRAAGVFVVELDQPLAEAPVDHTAVRRWLERVPTLRLDGERPTVAALARRLASFWLPTEPILYVGRSGRAIGPRLAALYATPLGDARPHAGGHWLKTLANPGRLRIWWAETDAHEEYEDALLSEIGARQPADVLARLPETTVVLPFANLADSAGTAKAHGIEDALREPLPDEPSMAPQPQAARPKPPAAGRRSGAAGPASGRRRATARPASARQQPPPAEPTYLSAAGVEQLQRELDELRDGVRPGVIERVKAARELGDLRENAEYESARKEQSFVEGRIQALEALLRSAVVVAAGEAGETVGVGSTVVVESDGESHTFVLVGSSEADPAAGRISYVSPVGQALIGRRVGDETAVRLPRGEVRYRVLEIR